MVLMVLRGEQFQRFGPAGCIYLTRRALSSYRATSPRGQFDVVSLQQKSGMTHGQLSDSRRRAVLGTYEGLTLHVRAGELCHGHIGESSSASQP
ncbi:MAG TPA: hypothetical protein VLE46_00565 [Nitrospira sp.]|nr:hypothetical protein [Nitrospira sp.]